MSELNTAEIREQIDVDDQNRQHAKGWFRFKLRETLDEVDRLTTIQNSLALSIETRTKEAIWRDVQILLKDECRPDKETISVAILKLVIGSAEVNIEKKSSV